MRETISMGRVYIGLPVTLKIFPPNFTLISNNTNKMRILLIDAAGGWLAEELAAAGHEVEVERDGRQGLVAAISQVFDAVIVDRHASGIDGLSLVQTLRVSQTRTILIVVSAVDEYQERVEGFRAGADVCLVRPVASAEVCARLDRIMWRANLPRPEVLLKVGDLSLHVLTEEVTRAGQRIKLEQQEYKVLKCLMRRKGEITSKATLLHEAWDDVDVARGNAISTLFSRMRSKVDRPFGDPLIHTVHGVGYTIYDSRSVKVHHTPRRQIA